MCSVDCCRGAGWPEFSKKNASTPSKPSSDQKSDEKASVGMCNEDEPTVALGDDPLRRETTRFGQHHEGV